MGSSIIKCPGVICKKLFLNKKSVIIFFVSLFVIWMGGLATASSGGEHGSKGWVATDTYRVMNFAVLAIALFLLLRKPVSDGLSSRIKGIKDELNELEAGKKAAEMELSRYQDKLDKLDQETEKLIAEYVKQGNDAKERILKEAESAAVKLEEQARRNIENEFKKARIKLKEEILEKALVKAEEMIKSKITAEDQDRLVDEYLEKVVA
ncbi:F-type H+-transporting ATPase subunit b [Desulfosarcina sp. BuS5]|uniref:F0F1 ATP synthase subunit B family protein n=1 Tax=Desulfosarcina sp. BuS5 TaxID=933262 RepID=UPI000686123F|nr:ATP synthase F0 subunit B [Desulfosarcina sp. BuS5]WDN89911.1 F-type H+-transporting ATPase subunit b [Desulfosarcina sp. BuS5]